MQHVCLRTEVELRILFLHIDMDAMDAAPYSLRGEEREKGGERKWKLIPNAVTSQKDRSNTHNTNFLFTVN